MSESGGDNPKATLDAFLTAQKPANQDLAAQRQAEELQRKEEERKRLMGIDKALKDLTGKKDLADFLTARGIEGVLMPGQPGEGQESPAPLLAVRGDGSIVLREPGQPEAVYRNMSVMLDASAGTVTVYEAHEVVREGGRERFSMIRLDPNSVERNGDFITGRKTEDQKGKALVGTGGFLADHMAALPADLTGKTLYSNLYDHLSTLVQPPAPTA